MMTTSEDSALVKIEPQEHGYAAPLHVQRLEKALELAPFLNYVQSILLKNAPEEAWSEEESAAASFSDHHGNQFHNGLPVSKSERRSDKARYYNLSQVKKGRKWLKNLLLSDSSSDDESGPEIQVTEADIRSMLRNHVREKKIRQQFYNDPELQQYQYYSSGLLSNYDKYSEKSVLANKAKREQRRMERKLMKARMKAMREEETDSEDDERPIRYNYAEFRQLTLNNQPGAVGRPTKKDKTLTIEQMNMKRRKIFTAIAKKEIPKAQKQMFAARKDQLTQLKKLAKESQKESRKRALLSQKIAREAQIRARRLSKEMMVYWRRFEKVEKEQRKRAEKEAQAQRKEDLEVKEMKRQQRKLNFLITQTELYAHFVARKTGEDHEEGSILSRLDDCDVTSAVHDNKALVDLVGDDYDAEATKSRALNNAERAFRAHQRHKDAFDHVAGLPSALSNPVISTDAERPQPSVFEGQLKSYQLKGMNWLANLYDQGINGILADEMGLGKTVQSIALLAHLAEAQGIWGPSLIVAPASTLHNWQQEILRFMPKFKVVPYWGNTQDRRILRKIWNSDSSYSENASFHVVITSYQLVIQDVKYFSRIKWHYMILDEAQAIKSQTSVRWKILLGFNCRNRLLLTGTPIQNTMQELWALLHFIMPTLFDSHEEFNEWFSKDIESHAERQSGIDEKHLSRLHMILKPFMLRRCKTEVENELSDKIEVLVYCPLTARQKMMYQAIKNKIRIEDLLQGGSVVGSATSSLMNLVMQFRKVCNHPELFERKEVRSPFYIRLQPYHIPKLIYRECLLEDSLPSKKHLLHSRLYIHDPAYIHSTLFHESHSDCTPHSTHKHSPETSHPSHGSGQDDVTRHVCSSCFSFTRFINISPTELHAFMLKGLLVRWLGVFLCFKEAYRITHEVEWRLGSRDGHLNKRDLLLTALSTTYFTNVSTSPNLQSLVFTHPGSTFIGHFDWTIHSMPETIGHRKIRLRRHSGKEGKDVHKKHAISPRSPHKTPISPLKQTSHDEDHVGVIPHLRRAPVTVEQVPSHAPPFLYHNMNKVMGQPFTKHTSDRMAEWQSMAHRLCGSPQAYHSLLYGTPDIYEHVRYAKWYFHPTQPQGLHAIQPKYGYSGVFVPDKETLVTDAGKLYVLDTLLAKLKAGGHRVLIYSQMTRMIDILEEYMWHRKHTYIRLDGSSKISDRRDMVADFQTRSDIFAFLLSTRAGGLGINLTAADTVIFYDSDWNPTVDQQAMDRAHRLGQTKQVTVYRLICKGTIEERILQRAKEKSEIQRMVISGGDYKPDMLKPKEVVSLLLGDDEMEKKFMAKSDEDKLLGSKPHFGLGIKRKASSSGRKGPGRPKKKKEENITVSEDTASLTPSHSTPTLSQSTASFMDDANISVDSCSIPPSPHSMVSQDDAVSGDELSADGLVVDDAPSKPSTPLPSTRGSGRKRGRPKGSGGSGRRPRGRGSIQKALHAAEAAAAQVGISKGYAAYGYSLQGTPQASLTPSPSRSSNSLSPVRGTSPRGRGRPPTRVSAKRSPKTP